MHCHHPTFMKSSYRQKSEFSSHSSKNCDLSIIKMVLSSKDRIIHLSQNKSQQYRGKKKKWFATGENKVSLFSPYGDFKISFSGTTRILGPDSIAITMQKINIFFWALVVNQICNDIILLSKIIFNHWGYHLNVWFYQLIWWFFSHING